MIARKRYTMNANGSELSNLKKKHDQYTIFVKKFNYRIHQVIFLLVVDIFSKHYKSAPKTACLHGH